MMLVPKALVAGVVAVFCLNVVCAIGIIYLVPYLIEPALGTDEISISSMPVAVGVLATVFATGIPAYLAASMASTAPVLHALLIGAFQVLLILLESEFRSKNALIVGMAIAVSMLVAAFAGYYRRRQIRAA